MGKELQITTLFLDVGGVLLNNGWEHQSRRLAAEAFDYDFDEMEARHHIIFETHEEGKVTLNQYFNRVLFYKKRDFTFNQVKDFMFAQSFAYPKMIEYIQELKELYNLKIAVVNNEAKDLNEYRIQKFQLSKFVDFFISSCFIHLRKPDDDIFTVALNIAQVRADEVVYIENTQMFVDVASELGIRSILHKDYLSTCHALASMGLKLE
jgi:putative hydrolase of the HAD superfamily